MNKKIITFFTCFLVFISWTEKDFAQSTIDKAYELYDAGKCAEALRLSLAAEREAKDDAQLAEAYSLSGACFYRLGDLESNLDRAIKCYEIDKKAGDKENLVISISNLASAYYSAGHHKEAEVFVLQAIEMRRPTDNAVGKSLVYGRAADVYFAQNQFEKALSYADTAVMHARASGDENNLAIRLCQQAHCLEGCHRFAEAEADYLQSIPIFEKTGNKPSWIIAHFQFGQLLAEQNKTAEAIGHLRQAEQALRSDCNDLPLLEKVCRRLSDVLAKTNPTSALEYLREAGEIHDSVFNQTMGNRYNLYSIQYQTAEKERQIAEQELQLKAEKQRSIYLIIIVSLFAVLVLVLAILIIHSRRNARYLRQQNEFQMKVFSIISHDLRSPAIAQQSALRMLCKNARSLDGDTLERMCLELMRESDAEVNLIDNLLRWAKIQMGRIEETAVARFNVCEAAKEALQQFQQTAEQKNINIQLADTKEIFVSSNRNMFIIILRNLVSNAIKFTPQNGNVTITMEESDNGVTIKVADTGIGIPSKMLAQLFDSQKNNKRSGTANETGSGLGLILCHELAQRCNGALTAESCEGEGTTFTLNLSNMEEKE